MARWAAVRGRARRVWAALKRAGRWLEGQARSPRDYLRWIPVAVLIGLFWVVKLLVWWVVLWPVGVAAGWLGGVINEDDRLRADLRRAAEAAFLLVARRADGIGAVAEDMAVASAEVARWARERAEGWRE